MPINQNLRDFTLNIFSILSAFAQPPKPSKAWQASLAFGGKTTPQMRGGMDTLILRYGEMSLNRWKTEVPRL